MNSEEGNIFSLDVFLQWNSTSAFQEKPIGSEISEKKHGEKPNRSTPEYPKAKSQSFHLPSAKGLKPVSVEVLNPQVDCLHVERGTELHLWPCWDGLYVREPPPRPPNIKLTHVSGTRPESANFGGSIETQFSVFCLTGLSRIVIRWQITPPITRIQG